MTSARRLLAAVSLAAGTAALAAPAAQAATPTGDKAPISVLDTVDHIGHTAIPEDQRAAMPKLANQLQGLNHLNDLNQLRQLTDMVQPITNLVPGIA
ncbi:hypothetical protein [Streptomyces flavofungini]|uniref:hypothetical protein n=1 Tax=Streptomyces flavofungini TaxID=68200 RepID=UPI0034E00079